MARESIVPWGRHKVFGLVREESVRWGIVWDKDSDKGKGQNLKGPLSHGEDFGLCSKAMESRTLSH